MASMRPEAPAPVEARCPWPRFLTQGGQAGRCGLHTEPTDEKPEDPRG